MQIALTTALSTVVYVDALGWVIGVVPVLYYALLNHSLPTIGKMRLLSGPFEKLGIEALIVAGILFVVVSSMKILAAYWLGHSRLDGAVLELILLGLSTIFWYGFDLPFGPPLGVVQVVLFVLSWKTLH